jgi:c(7)-type cytochrome triheme protein
MRNAVWHRAVVVTVAVTAMSLGLAAVGLAETLPRLPGPLALQGSGGSPGPVTFEHRSHLDDKRPGCTSCHPALFRILKAGPRTADGPITHAAMDAGRQCGACHDGKSAFGLDECALCHREQK